MIQIPVLLDRDDLLVVSKPAGLPVIPTREDPEAPTVRSLLEGTLGGPVWIVHRLDRETSGVLVVARTGEAHRRLSMAFEGRAVSKTYLAICRRSRPDALTAGRIDVPLVEGRKGGMRAARPGAKGALPAVTRFRLIGIHDDLAVVEAHPETGRTHQIRVHLAEAGWPLAVDPRYGGQEPLVVGEARCERLSLHARRLTLPEESLDVTAPLPDDLSSVVAALLQRTLD